MRGKRWRQFALSATIFSPGIFSQFVFLLKYGSFRGLTLRKGPLNTLLFASIGPRDNAWYTLQKVCIVFLVFFSAIVLWGIPCSAALSLTHPPPDGEGFNETVAEIPLSLLPLWNATVKIEWMPWPSTSNQTHYLPTRGSGVIIDKTDNGEYVIIVTNSHVLKHVHQKGTLLVGFNKKLTHAQLKGNSPSYYHGHTHYWSKKIFIFKNMPEKDLAFLKVKVPWGAEYQVAFLSDLEEQTLPTSVALYSIGYPMLTLRKVWNSKRPANFRAHIKRFSEGRLLKVYDDYPFKRSNNQPPLILDFIFHNVDLLPGNSGGPLCDEQGRMIGLNTFMFLDKQGLTYRYCAGEKIEGTDIYRYFCAAIPSSVILKEYFKLQHEMGKVPQLVQASHTISSQSERSIQKIPD